MIFLFNYKITFRNVFLFGPTGWTGITSGIVTALCISVSGRNWWPCRVISHKLFRPSWTGHIYWTEKGYIHGDGDKREDGGGKWHEWSGNRNLCAQNQKMTQFWVPLKCFGLGMYFSYQRWACDINYCTKIEELKKNHLMIWYLCYKTENIKDINNNHEYYFMSWVFAHVVNSRVHVNPLPPSQFVPALVLATYLPPQWSRLPMSWQIKIKFLFHFYLVGSFGLSLTNKIIFACVFGTCNLSPQNELNFYG